MVSLGAKHLVFLSRSRAKSDAAKELIEELRGKSCGLGVYECDVSDKSRLASVIGEFRTTMPPIKGCVQGWMQLKVNAHVLPYKRTFTDNFRTQCLRI
jgi:NAD(P)-dependent dehydrogenase (short-subunit alcohol dehydrogenase family)